MVPIVGCLQRGVGMPVPDRLLDTVEVRGTEPRDPMNRPATRTFTGSERLPRELHPGAWWLWALGLATAASRTTNPLLLGLIMAVAGYVVAVRRCDEPWARSYGVFLRLGLLVIAIRTLLHIVFGGAYGT